LCGWVRVTADRPLRSEQQQHAGSRGRPRGVVHLYESRNVIRVRFEREDNPLSLSLSLSLSLASLFHCARNCKVSNHRTRTRMHEEGREREREREKEREREREREEVDRARERADRELSARIYVTQRCNQRTRGDRKTRSLPFSPSAPAGRRIVHKFRFYSRERENNDR